MKKTRVVFAIIALCTSAHAWGEAHASIHVSESVHESINEHEESAESRRPRPIVYVAHGVNPSSVCKSGVDKVDESGSQVAVTCSQQASNVGTILALCIGLIMSIALAALG